MVKNLTATVGDTRDGGLTLGLRRYSGEGNGKPLQYPCLESSMDRGDRWAPFHGVAKNWT